MSQKILEDYKQYLQEMELADTTVKSYVKEAKNLLLYAGDSKLDKALVIAYKAMLEQKGFQVGTVNWKIIAINRFLRYYGKNDSTVKTKKCQRRQSIENIITEEDYRRLTEYAMQTGRLKYYLIMRTMALTGIRVGELKYVTVEAVWKGYTKVNNKGKIREIYLPDSLTMQLKEYCKGCEIAEGVVFRGKGTQPISRKAIWKMLIFLGESLEIDRRKVHPHSFRHYFALSYMKKYSNLFELADILGHSSLETTRIYTTASIEQKRKRMEELDNLI